MCLTAGVDVCGIAEERVLAVMGRMKYIRPVFSAMKRVFPGAAQEIYLRNKGSYHSIARTLLEKDLK
jgi:hypothetical protein